MQCSRVKKFHRHSFPDVRGAGVKEDHGQVLERLVILFVLGLSGEFEKSEVAVRLCVALDRSECQYWIVPRLRESCLKITLKFRR